MRFCVIFQIGYQEVMCNEIRKTESNICITTMNEVEN